MKTGKLTPSQSAVLKELEPRDLRALRKRPHLVRDVKHLSKACKKVIKVVEALHQYTNARRRQTAYKRIIKICSNALERAES